MATVQASSSRTAAATGFLAGSLVTLVSAWLVQKMQLSFWNKKEDSSSSASSFSKPTTTQATTQATTQMTPHQQQQQQINGNDNKKNHIPQELRDEQLSRHNLYFGDAGMDKLRNANICVVGVGGVGSHTAHMLARAGVGYIRLIDFDQVTLSSLNRHAVAVLADVGIPKVTCLANFLQQICPDTAYLKVDPVAEMYTAESGPRLLQLPADVKWDLVIDAIDDVPTKAALVAQCLKAGIRVLSCMGAGGKSDVTRVHVSDLKTAARDPLATKLRQTLKQLLGDDTVNSNKINFGNANIKKSSSSNNNGDKMNHKKKKDKDDDNSEYLENMQQVTVVYSSEKTVVKLADFSDEQKDAYDDGADGGTAFNEYGAVDNMRVRVLPVLGTMPAVMGQALAAVALTDLGGKPFQAVPMEKISKNVRNKVHQKLMRREELLTRTMFKLVNKRDPDEKGNDDGLGALLWKELNSKGGMIGGVWVGPLAIDIDDFDYLLDVWRNRCAVTGARLGTVLQLTRWDDQRPGTCDNLVLMSQHALLAFDKEGGKDKIPVHVRQKIEARLATCVLDRFPAEE